MSTEKLLFAVGVVVLVWGFTKSKKKSDPVTVVAKQTAAEKQFADNFNDNPYF